MQKYSYTDVDFTKTLIIFIIISIHQLMNYYKLLIIFFRGQDKENELRTRFSVDNAFNCKYVAFLALYVHAMIKF